MERYLQRSANGRQVLNPSTGNMVAADGRAGRRAQADHRDALVASGAALPHGALGRLRARPAEFVERTMNFRGSVRTGAFKLDKYAPAGTAPRTTAEFAKIIATQAAATPHYRQATVTFVDADGYNIRRTIHGNTPTAILKSLDTLQSDSTLGGSDVIPASFSLSTGSFEIGSVHPPRGGAYKFAGISKGAGRAHPHFKLVEFAVKAAPGDCLLAVLRAVAKAAGAAAQTARNSSIREHLAIPPGNIQADAATIERLARHFGLRIRVITGMAARPDAEREYDDDPARLFDRNLCTNAEASPVVIAAGGADDAPACDVYLAEGHYEFISRILEPIRLCRITGDIIPADDPRSPADIARRVVSQGRRWYAEQQKPKTQPARKHYTERIIVYDYETTYEPDGELTPYALGYIVFDPTDPSVKDADRHLFAGRAAQVTQIVRRPGENRFAVSQPLIDEILRAPDDVRFTLVSFNGARFDHFLLAQAANNRGVLTSVFATSAGGLRSLVVAGRHSTLDLAKLVPATSLDAACEGFKTSPVKVRGFSHVTIQREHEAGRLYTWLAENGGQLCEYLAADVLSTASLFVLLAQALKQVTGQPVYGNAAVQTIGSHAWALMSAKCELPKRVADQELDRTIRSAIVGGRVQAYTDERVIEEEQLAMVDFASLYPTAMAAVPKAQSCFYPLERWGVYPAGAANGEPTRVDRWTPGEVGVYLVRILEQPPGLPNVLPRRVEGEPLDWAFRGQFETMATHIDLSLISRGGGSFVVQWGLVWPVVRLGLFRPFIEPLAALKDEQDQLKAAKAPGFNPALRMVYKLLMNSASGKTAQRNYDECVTLATGSAQQLAAEAKMDADRPRTWIPLGGETCIIIGSKPSEKVYTARAKPSILAVLIYAYSRALVWRTLCQHNCLYSDTDSGLFRMADYEALRAAFPDLDPAGRAKELGDLEQELGGHTRAEAFLLGAKDYAIFLYDADGKLCGFDESARGTHSKLRTKGVCLPRDRLLAPGAAAELADSTLAELGEVYNAAGPAAQSSPLSDVAVAREFYARRAAGEPVEVLCSQIVRSFKDPDRPLSLTQRYVVKKLEPRAPQLTDADVDELLGC